MTDNHRPTALIIGGGPAGLMAADVLSNAGADVTVADRMPSLGRKFLMAGKSGLNLTKVEDRSTFDAAYGAQPPALANALTQFGPQDVIDWATDLGQPVFTGSTGRVFPVAMKASPLLRAWLGRLTAQGVQVRTRWTWTGWDDGAVLFDTPAGQVRITPDVTVLALGGASWRRLGSDGAWASLLDDVAPFTPSNCGFQIAWSDHMRPFFGTPVKAAALTAGSLTSRGEWVVTRSGIEGGGVYAVASQVIRGAPLLVDLVPDMTAADVARRMAGQRSKASLTRILTSALRLPPVKIALFHEWSRQLQTTQHPDPALLVKALPVTHAGPTPLDQAISTAGGLRFGALDTYMLRQKPGTFVAGEMLDWDAPTGGYLLTACLATGRAAGQSAVSYLARIDRNQPLPRPDSDAD